MSGVPRALGVGAFALLVVYGLLEAAVQLIYRPSVPPVAAERTETDVDTLATPDLRAGRERAGLGFRDPSMCIHPYFGYVFLPNEERTEPGHPGIAISPDGFLDARPAVRTRAEGKLLVGLTGGSVAGQLGTWHAELLDRALRSDPAFENLEIEFVWLGMPGYHQPQQLFQLSYILAQGGELDLLVNLDGFNEVAVPAVLNAPQGAHPLFPMNWSMVALDVPDTRVRRAIGAVAYLEEERTRRRAGFHDSFLSYSPIAKLMWSVDDRKLERRIADYAWELGSITGEDVPWFVRGPEHVGPDALVAWCVGVWERCSRQMQALCVAHGIRYVHVLQPNQYDPGSKPLSSEEKDKAFDGEGPYRGAIEAGYPLLREAGARLRDTGIAFVDLSGVFAGVEETLYVDSCCHFNEEGNRLVAAAIAKAAHDVF